MPIGAVAGVAVTIESVATPQRDESASPRKPSVETDARSEKDESFDVWCFNAAILRGQRRGCTSKRFVRTDTLPVALINALAVVLDLERFAAMLAKGDLCPREVSSQRPPRLLIPRTTHLSMLRLRRGRSRQVP